jgi:hypothetical protein
MPDDTDRRPLDAARRGLADARRASRRRFLDAARAANELDALRRSLGADDERVRAAEAELAERERALARARDALVGAKGTLAGTLDEFIGRDPTLDLSRLRGDLPLVLLPLRLETRFVTGDAGPALLVRIYPDTIHGTAHDPLLTAAERDAGLGHWARAWAGNEAQAWRELVREVPATRAAWIVRATEPTNLDDRPEGEPVFPAVELRADPWDAPAEAHLLPDRWLALAYRSGAEVGRAASGPVREPLVVGFDPHAPPGEGVDISGDGLELDADVLWAVDFAEAEAAGMALRLPLGPDDVQLGFDRLLVLGVKGSLAPEESQAGLERLLDAHHYSGGLAFLAQGTPTNNTERATSAYPPPDPEGARSFVVERGPPLDAAEGDGVRTMRALGLDPALVRHVEGADRREEVVARAMGQALWPVTFGYYLQQMLAPHVSGEAIELGRRYFVEHVRGRGLLPTVRVRSQPYGLLPVSSLDRWQPRRDAGRAERAIVDLLRRLRPVWQAQTGRVPRVGASSDPDADLLAVLGMDASAREVRVRAVHGPDWRRNFFDFVGLNGAAWEAAQVGITDLLMALIGFPDWNPRLLHVDFADGVGRFRFPLVAPAPLSEEAGLEAVFGFDYVRWVREASVDDLRDERLPEGRQAPQTLLYRMLRHARLAELARVGIDLQVANGLAGLAERHEPELVGVAPATAARPTIWQRLAQPIPPLTGALTLGEFLTTSDAPEATPLRDYCAALEALEGLPTAALERLFGETLDLCTSRLDAWVTSLAGKRLLELREGNPAGVYVGGYGWVEALRPEPPGRAGTTRLPDGRIVRLPTSAGGFVQAPSMQHATAAAVLRNGHLTRSGESGAPFAVDLSSARVRMALAVLDTVREGQPLGAVLGYQVERGLHDRAVDWFIEPLRRRFPAVANKSGDAELEGPPDAIAARSVVDGVALRRAFIDGTLDLTAPEFFRAGAPPTGAELAAAQAELRRLDDALDAIADLLTAESVYQLVGGNTAGANAGLDAMARGGRPPDPEVAMQPRPGIPLTHRVALVLGGDPVPAPGWDAPATPRARVEPWVDAWLGALFGDPGAARCRVRLAPPDESARPVEREVTLAALGVRPIDLLALARAASADVTALSELDQRVVDAALAAEPPGARVEAVLYERDPAWPRDTVRAFPELFDVAHAADRLLAAARPLAAADLVPAEAAASLPETDPMAAETAARADGARGALTAARDALVQAVAASDPAGMMQALRVASLFGFRGALPRGESSGAALAARAVDALAELERRVATATAASEPAAVVAAAFGRELPFLPRLTPPGAAELAQALAAGPALVGDAEAPRRWLYQASRVRAPLARWRALALRAGVLGTDGGTLDVAQLPHRPAAGARWVALPLEPGAEPVARTLSLLLHRVAAPPATEPWVGLFVDEWNEVVPTEAPTTGVAFHFDSPGAEAPQCVLIAVPSSLSERWTLDELVATVSETLDLAKLRTVDGELLGVLGQLTPAVYLAANAANDTVSTRFHDALVPDHPLVATVED